MQTRTLCMQHDNEHNDNAVIHQRQVRLLIICALNVCRLQHPQNNYCQNHSGIATLCWQL